MIDSVYWTWFQLMFGYGTRRAQLFMSYFENPQALYEEIAAGGRAAGMLKDEELALCKASLDRAHRITQQSLNKGITIITPDSPLYPRLLAEIYSKPAVLYVAGDLSCLQECIAIAMVGSRKATPYGREVAGYLAGGLASHGVVVVSGLADGIDTICHTAALDAGGKTVGLLGCGLDWDYPKGRFPLKTRMRRQGAVVTEYPLGYPIRRENFQIRNRLISGVSAGVVVVEAKATSGTMITANHALEQGRDVFAVPGSILSELSRGAHMLINEGAKLVETPEDILVEYGYEIEKNTAEDLYNNQPRGATIKEEHPPRQEQTALPVPPSALPPELTGEARLVYEHMEEPLSVDALAAECEMDIAQLHTALTELEIYGYAENRPGRIFARSAP